MIKKELEKCRYMILWLGKNVHNTEGIKFDIFVERWIKDRFCSVSWAQQHLIWFTAGGWGQRGEWESTAGTGSIDIVGNEY